MAIAQLEAPRSFKLDENGNPPEGWSIVRPGEKRKRPVGTENGSSNGEHQATQDPTPGEEPSVSQNGTSPIPRQWNEPTWGDIAMTKYSKEFQAWLDNYGDPAEFIRRLPLLESIEATPQEAARWKAEFVARSRAKHPQPEPEVRPLAQLVPLREGISSRVQIETNLLGFQIVNLARRPFRRG